MKHRFTAQDEAWMARALQLAEKAEGEGEVPVGAVLVGPDGALLAVAVRPVDEAPARGAPPISI